MKLMPVPLKEKIVPGSKVPVSFLIDYLMEGYSISDFVAAYPWVKKSTAKKVLQEIKDQGVASQYAL